MKRLVIGILAHVDAGKTTLSEAMLYLTGRIRKLGRVDTKDAFLDTFALERARGITIFSKQAFLSLKEAEVTLVDTPGHVDFSAEMERTLQILDYAVLVISAADGIQGHTKTLWSLLKKYHVPTFIFVNKMDQPGMVKEDIFEKITKELSEHCVDFSNIDTEEFHDSIAMCDEGAMEEFLEKGRVSLECIRDLIGNRNLFPCYFGSALRLEGIQALLNGISEYSCNKDYPKEFGARVYKIARDDSKNRLTYMKITGGKLQVRDILSGKDEWEEKVTQIRCYHGDKYETVTEVLPGMVCAVTGLSYTLPGDGIGYEKAGMTPVLEPVLSYEIRLEAGVDPRSVLPLLKQLEEEEPELHIVWNEELREIHAQLMGEVQIEVLKVLIRERLGIEVTFGEGKIVYRETIANTVEGVGHFEPLRHYAEVHLLLEPGEPGSGIQIEADCREDKLATNWQRLILTHLEEKKHRGVLTGSQITDIKITLIAGKAHLKHTEGGDFRQATYRAVRQGLMQAQSVLLEPYYDFVLELPDSMTGRAMVDLERMSATFGLPEMDGDTVILKGHGPVSTMRNYQKEVATYSKGLGHLACTYRGYGPCLNSEEVIEKRGYDPERDLRNPCGSVFCAHGAGFVVPWNEVFNYMHVESPLSEKKDLEELCEIYHAGRMSSDEKRDFAMGTEEVDEILYRATSANSGSKTKGYQKSKSLGKRTISATEVTYRGSNHERKEPYLLVDGYNIIHAWNELKELAAINLDGARGKLMDILCNYQGITKVNLIVVFDAYRVKGHDTEVSDYHNIHVVHTKEAETADAYIEKFAHEHGKRYDITVATSDGLEQIIIRGQGCKLLSAREFEDEIIRTQKRTMEDYAATKERGRIELGDFLTGEEKEVLHASTGICE